MHSTFLHFPPSSTYNLLPSVICQSAVLWYLAEDLTTLLPANDAETRKNWKYDERLMLRFGNTHSCAMLHDVISPRKSKFSCGRRQQLSYHILILIFSFIC